MKNFNEHVYKQDLEMAPFHVSQIFDDVVFTTIYIQELLKKMLP